MFDMARHAEVTRLLDAVEAAADRLTPNELELYRSLKAKYAAPDHNDFDDAVCLEVILRNIEVRKRHNMDPRKDPGRVIELERKGPGGQGSGE